MLFVLFSQGTNNNVKAIVLDQMENFSTICMAEGFSNMSNLVLLMLYHNNFSGNLDFLSNNLRYLLWHGYPFTSLPSNFEPDYLVELNMPDSRAFNDCGKAARYFNSSFSIFELLQKIMHTCIGIILTKL